MRETQVTFSLENTTADRFALWLEDYTQTTSPLYAYIDDGWFFLESISPSLPITRPTTIDMDAIEVLLGQDTKPADRLLGLTQPKQRLDSVISFKLEPLALNRVSVTARCTHPDVGEVMDYFRSLMIAIARRWPSAAKVIAKHFPPDLPPPSSMKSLAILNTDLDSLEALLRRFATDFARHHHLGNSIRVEEIPRDFHLRGKSLAPWEAMGWSIEIKTIQELRLTRPRKVTITEATCLFQSFYVYPIGDRLELLVPDHPILCEDDDLHPKFIDAFVEKLEWLGLVRSAQAKRSLDVPRSETRTATYHTEEATESLTPAGDGVSDRQLRLAKDTTSNKRKGRKARLGTKERVALAMLLVERQKISWQIAYDWAGTSNKTRDEYCDDAEVLKILEDLKEKWPNRLYGKREEQEKIEELQRYLGIWEHFGNI